MSIFQDFLYENKAIGGFTNKEFKTHFEYRVSEGNAPRQGDWGIQNGLRLSAREKSRQKVLLVRVGLVAS